MTLRRNYRPITPRGIVPRELTKMARDLEKLTSLGGDNFSVGSNGFQIREPDEDRFYAHLSAYDEDSGVYTWTEVIPDGAGGWALLGDGRSGGPGGIRVYEASGAVVALPTYVELHRGVDGELFFFAGSDVNSEDNNTIEVAGWESSIDSLPTLYPETDRITFSKELGGFYVGAEETEEDINSVIVGILPATPTQVGLVYPEAQSWDGKKRFLERTEHHSVCLYPILGTPDNESFDGVDSLVPAYAQRFILRHSYRGWTADPPPEYERPQNPGKIMSLEVLAQGSALPAGEEDAYQVVLSEHQMELAIFSLPAGMRFDLDPHEEFETEVVNPDNASEPLSPVRYACQGRQGITGHFVNVHSLTIHGGIVTAAYAYGSSGDGDGDGDGSGDGSGSGDGDGDGDGDSIFGTGLGVVSSGSSSVSMLTMEDATVEANTLLVVSVLLVEGVSQTIGVTFNGNPMTPASTGTSSAGTLAVYYLPVNTLETGDIVASIAGDPAPCRLSAVQVSGLADRTVDTQDVQGGGGPPVEVELGSSTSVVDTYIHVAGVLSRATTPIGTITWDSPYTSGGQDDASSVGGDWYVLTEGYLIPSATGTHPCSLSGFSANPDAWALVQVAFR